VYLLAMLVPGINTGAASGPVLRAWANNAKVPAPPGIYVEASDAAGLDALTITWVEGDLTYQTQLSGASTLKRSFPLAALFPHATEVNKQLRLLVAVRNTRGESASIDVVVPSRDPQKGK